MLTAQLLQQGWAVQDRVTKGQCRPLHSQVATARRLQPGSVTRRLAVVVAASQRDGQVGLLTVLNKVLVALPVV
jgi:hypothetical protein